MARPLCAERMPELREIGDDHRVACHFSPESPESPAFPQGGRP
jgi:hypothetical protein